MSDRKVVGMIGLFDDPDSLITAAEAARDAGYTKWDCHTPYPVHGLDDAMGLKPSPMPYITLIAGFIGAGLAMYMMYWMSAVDYPIRIGGKEYFSWPAFIPITFEGFVLFAAPATFGTYATLSNGQVFSFDGTNCDLHASDGTHLLSLGSLPASTFTKSNISKPYKYWTKEYKPGKNNMVHDPTLLLPLRIVSVGLSTITKRSMHQLAKSTKSLYLSIKNSMEKTPILLLRMTTML